MPSAEIYNTTHKYLGALDSRGDFGHFLAEEVTIEIPGNPSVPKVVGRDAVEEFIRNFHQVAFEASVDVRRVLAGDATSTAELVFDGVHVGEFAGVPATRAHVRLPYCAAYDFDGDVISAMRVYLSVSDLIAQVRS